MKKVIRLTESDLTRIVRRVLKEAELEVDKESKVTAKITSTASTLLNNDSETFNTSIGVKTIPACWKYSTELQQVGITDGEAGAIVDLLDWPMSQDDADRAERWAQGSGLPGSFASSYQEYGRLKGRIVQDGGLWYPAVEDLRVKYNIDEYFEDLGSETSVAELSGFRSELINAYQTWIDCVNGTKTSWR